MLAALRQRMEDWKRDGSRGALQVTFTLNSEEVEQTLAELDARIRSVSPPPDAHREFIGLAREVHRGIGLVIDEGKEFIRDATEQLSMTLTVLERAERYLRAHAETEPEDTTP